MTNPHFFIHNSAHAGDVILTRPFIQELRIKFPDAKITLECIERNRYLWEDLDLPVMTYDGEDYFDSFQSTPNCPEDAVFLNMWFGTSGAILFFFGLSFANNLHLFNMYMEHYGMGEMFYLPERRKSPLVEFYHDTPLPIEVMENGILIENGEVFSEQSGIHLKDHLHEFAAAFPNLNFYCSALPGFNAKNIIDCSKLNLIELSEVGNRCMALLTRGSGVNAATQTEKNRYKLRCIAGWMVAFGYSWHSAENPVYFASNIQEVRDFLELVSNNCEHISRYISDISINPDVNEKYLRRNLENAGAKGICSFLCSADQVVQATEYLRDNLLPCQVGDNNNWVMAWIISDLSDGNLLDYGSNSPHMLKNALLKGIPGKKYSLSLKPPTELMLPSVIYMSGSIYRVNLPDAYFRNITCLSVVDHGVEICKVVNEISRLLAVGGKLYMTFSYWEPKKESGREILDRRDVIDLVSECENAGLKLVRDIDWQLGDEIIADTHDPSVSVGYTLGMLVFIKN